MALPATKNITYYRGDTYNFVLKPLNADGTARVLVDENDNPYDVFFYVSTNRVIETPSDVTACIAVLDLDTNTIGCQIPATIGKDFSPGTAYVYEVKIKNTDNGEVYTLVTGNLTVNASVEVV